MFRDSLIAQLRTYLAMGLAALLSAIMVGCSDEDASQIDSIREMAEAVEKMPQPERSTFNDNCADPLQQLLDTLSNRDEGAMNASEQNRAVTILRLCIEEIRTEIVLTETESKSLAETSQCLTAARQARQSVSSIINKTNRFESLPNRSKEESLAVGLNFGSIGISVIGTGTGVSINRLSVCAMEKVVPGGLTPET